MQLDREDLIDGLREIVRESHSVGVSRVSIRIVGGAAIRLAHFERTTTADIDAQIEPMNQIAPIVEKIAGERGWPRDWLNDAAVGFIPAWGRAVDWESLFDDDTVSISVAPIDALLAMKLNAARPGRDTEDIAKLMALNEVDSVDAAEDLFEGFYPGDSLAPRTLELVRRILTTGLPSKPTAPPPPHFA